MITYISQTSAASKLAQRVEQHLASESRTNIIYRSELVELFDSLAPSFGLKSGSAAQTAIIDILLASGTLQPQYEGTRKTPQSFIIHRAVTKPKPLAKHTGRELVCILAAVSAELESRFENA